MKTFIRIDEQDELFYDLLGFLPNMKKRAGDVLTLRIKYEEQKIYLSLNEVV